ncbi:MAG: hypothetical protein LBN74_01420 [Prevotella sp.]|jgi:hypothetical protein|nr:hypothetical protein [Prevotella sp.]
MPNFGETERYIKSLFCVGKYFSYDGINCKVLKCGKPAPNSGECKTDVYVLTQDEQGTQKEFKISVKQDNADFLENKTSLERAIEILGKDAQTIIKNCTNSIKDKFESDYLIYFKAVGRTEALCVKIGWKYELLNKPGGEKSREITLTDQQKIDIYAGSNLDESKKNCSVNGEIINDSGVANFIINVDKDGQSLDYYLERMKTIEDFATKQNIYFACKALNYRCSRDKWDGNRPLAVYVDWILKDDKLYSSLVFENPLSTKGNEIGEKIRQILSQLKITKDNFDDLKKYLSDGINYIE